MANRSLLFYTIVQQASCTELVFMDWMNMFLLVAEIQQFLLH